MLLLLLALAGFVICALLGSVLGMFRAIPRRLIEREKRRQRLERLLEEPTEAPTPTNDPGLPETATERSESQSEANTAVQEVVEEPEDIFERLTRGMSATAKTDAQIFDTLARTGGLTGDGFEKRPETRRRAQETIQEIQRLAEEGARKHGYNG
ncbi:hypothetical protein [Gordonia spumicola]|nr:hypothetical protein [Gordonia spumicola]